VNALQKIGTREVAAASMLGALSASWEVIPGPPFDVPFPLYTRISWDLTGIPAMISLLFFGPLCSVYTCLIGCSIIFLRGNVPGGTLKLIAELATLLGFALLRKKHAGLFQKRPTTRWQFSVTVDQLFAFALSAFSFALFCYELTLYALNEALFFSWLFAFSFLLWLWLQTKRTREESKPQSEITLAQIGAVALNSTAAVILRVATMTIANYYLLPFFYPMPVSAVVVLLVPIALFNLSQALINIIPAYLIYSRVAKVKE
jgi:riboflavin transporter FmnP